MYKTKEWFLEQFGLNFAHALKLKKHESGVHNLNPVFL